MSNGRAFPFRLFVWSVVLVAVAAASVYLAYDLVVKPRQALQDQIREQNGLILKLEQEKQRLEAFLRSTGEVIITPGTRLALPQTTP